MTVRIGLIGAGGMGRAHLARIANDLSGGEIVAVADINHDAAVSAAEPYGAKAYDSADELINDPNVDAVIIATFGKVHAPDVIKVIEAGKYVLCEKPLATTLPDALALSEAAEASPGQVMVGFENRWNPKFQMVREMLREAATPLIAQRVLLQDTEFVPRRMLSWAGKSSPAWFLMPHTLDLAMWISGAEPVEVFARGVRKVLVPDGSTPTTG